MIKDAGETELLHSQLTFGTSESAYIGKGGINGLIAKKVKIRTLTTLGLIHLNVLKHWLTSD